MQHSHLFGLLTELSLSDVLKTLLPIGVLACASATGQELALPEPHQADVVYEHYHLRDGETVEDLRLHYATLGSPHRNPRGDIDNAVLVLHWTGNSGSSVMTPEYMQALYGPGRPLDARRYYLIIPDNFGHGKSTRPSEGLRAKFPHYGYNDLVDLQHKLVTETLGVKHLHSILGMSMGGMNAWQWAEKYPDEMDGIMPVVSLPVTVSGRNLLWRRIVIDGIRNDPDWKQGEYAKAPRAFIQGYQVLRMMIDGVAHLQTSIPDTKTAESYLADINTQTELLDPNDLLYSLEASQDYDVEQELPKIQAKVFALNFDDDEFNPDELGILQKHMNLIRNGSYVVQPKSPFSSGHLTMAHPQQWASHVQTFMDSLENR